MQRIEVFSGSGRRRRWSGGAEGADLCRDIRDWRNGERGGGLPPQQLFTWRREVQRVRAGASRMAFAPVVLETARSCAGAEPVGRGQSVGSLAIEIIIGAATVRVPPGTERGFAARFARADDHAVMITIPSGVRVLVATKPVDFRKGGEGLAALVRAALGEDPFSGTLFVFRRKRADRIKILAWDGSALVLFWKRLEHGAFRWPPICDGMMRLSASQLAALIDGLDCSRLHARESRVRLRLHECCEYLLLSCQGYRI